MKIIALSISLLFSLSVLAARVEVSVSNMSCKVCVEKITKAMNETGKVENLQVSVGSVSFDEAKGKRLSDSEINGAIKKAGDHYEVGKIRRH
jgi:copper chaperone CopZ